MDAVTEAIEAGDIDELTRLVERLCVAGAWDELVSLRDRSRAAIERGRQLWPVASHAEYRLALEAPAEYAASVLVEGTGHLASGPLAEVAAFSHTWAELAPHLVPGPRAAVAAHERVLRGEVIDPDSVVYSDVFALPLRLESWESRYVLATYRAEGGEFPSPDPPSARVLDLPADASGRILPDDDVVTAVRAALAAFAPQPHGHMRMLAVEGTAWHAIGRALARDGVGEVYGAAISAAQALAWVAWAAAGGGHFGPRRGAAAGRDAAWSVGAALAGFDPLAEPQPDELGAGLTDLSAWWWGTSDARHGWVLRLAFEDPADGLAWVVDVLDPP